VTRNGASSWKVVTAPGDNLVQDVSCPAAATCFGTVASGAIDKTTDGGKKWKSKTALARFHLCRYQRWRRRGATD
jgi:photosystem II stability/assembly factor-like uncharacterized protein